MCEYLHYFEGIHWHCINVRHSMLHRNCSWIEAAQKCKKLIALATNVLDCIASWVCFSAMAKLTVMCFQHVRLWSQSYAFFWKTFAEAHHRADIPHISKASMCTPTHNMILFKMCLFKKTWPSTNSVIAISGHPQRDLIKSKLLHVSTPYHVVGK